MKEGVTGQMADKKGVRIRLKNRGPDERGGYESGRRLYTSVLILLVALVMLTMVTVAWLSIADNTRVRSMSMDVTSGVSLRFDLDAHETFEQYVKTLGFGEIAARISSEQGFDMRETPLEPVTTSDYRTFTFENGAAAQSGSGVYLEFVLHFMASEDMVVHLTSENSGTVEDGTLISSQNAGVVNSMRISFTADGQTSVYDAGMTAGSVTQGEYKIFGLPEADDMAYTDDNALFSLKAGENKEVAVHIWLEGTDESCTDALKGAGYSIRLKFEGTDADNRSLRDEERR